MYSVSILFVLKLADKAEMSHHCCPISNKMDKAPLSLLFTISSTIREANGGGIFTTSTIITVFACR